MKRTSASKGFTLIELLVVIAIIAILAAILFPVFMAAKNSAHAAGCASNLKQLGQATMAYVADYGTYEGMISAEQYYWPFVEPNPKYGFAGDSGRSSGIFRYIKNASFIKCPRDNGKIWVDNVDHGIVVKGFYTLAWSYCFNHGVPDSQRLNTYWRSSKMPMWVEENIDQKLMRNQKEHHNIINDLSFAGSDITSYKHSGKANVCFLDGHVGRLPGGLDQGDATWPDGTYIFREGKKGR